LAGFNFQISLIVQNPGTPQKLVVTLTCLLHCVSEKSHPFYISRTQSNILDILCGCTKKKFDRLNRFMHKLLTRMYSVLSYNVRGQWTYRVVQKTDTQFFGITSVIQHRF